MPSADGVLVAAIGLALTGAGLPEAATLPDGPDVVIRLRSPDGTTEFTANALSVARFLEATYCLVAADAELARTDIDADIAAILARGTP
jgi:hypothetical protein